MSGIGIGLIGTGFMGKCHALAIGAVRAVMGDVPEPRLAALCDTPADRARATAEQFDFARATDDWRSLVADPEVELVSIATPNRFHCAMALAAISAGKHVWCEKPLGLTLAEADRMAAAARAGVKRMAGYNHLKNPAFTHAQRRAASGGCCIFAARRRTTRPIPNCPGPGGRGVPEAGLGGLAISAAIWSASPGAWSVRSRA